MNRALSVLFIGVIAVSFAAIFIRLADAPALVIAAYRLGLASLALWPVALWRARDEIMALKREEAKFILLSGALLSLHFALWIASLERTTVASSVVLVTTSPLFVALASHLTGQDRIGQWTACGVLVATIGGIVVGYGDLSFGSRAWWGDILALGGAMAAAGYFMVGRRLRRGTGLLTYASTAYSVAAVVTIILCIGTRQSFTGYSKETYLMFILLALVPQLIGHSAFNWALGHLSAPFVSANVLGEPVGATILAYFILGEVPTLGKIMGGALILGGVYIASLGERRALEALSV